MLAAHGVWQAKNAGFVAGVGGLRGDLPNWFNERNENGRVTRLCRYASPIECFFASCCSRYERLATSTAEEDWNRHSAHCAEDDRRRFRNGLPHVAGARRCETGNDSI
jgi:hypothetical protein